MKITKFLSLLSVLCLAAISNLALAGSAGFTAGSAITDISARGIGIDIYTTSLASPMGCTYANVFRIPTSAVNYSVLVSTTLTLYASGKSAAFYVYGCDTDGASLVSGVRSQ